MHAQTITLTVNNVSLDSVFARIQEQSPYHFVYTSEELTGTRKVSFSVQKAPIEAVLGLTFKNQPVDYSTEEKYIYVRKRQENKVENGPPAALIEVHGKVVDAEGRPVPGVTVSVKGSPRKAATNENGEFDLKADENAELIFTSVNMETSEVRVARRTRLEVSLRPKVTALGGVTVEYSSGYEKRRTSQTPGSVDVVSNAVINRSVTTDILTRLDGVVSGLTFTKNVSPTSSLNQSTFSIRGRSTIFSNPNPLIIVDNFPYDGDINNINPNDVETISVLKDAVTASVWGSFSGNGVVVITMKKGKNNQPIRISVNSNLTVGQKPNFNYGRGISPSSYVDLETYFYNNGFFTSSIGNPSTPISPVVDILNRQKLGVLSSADATAQLNLLRSHDIRTDLAKYFYQPSVGQQYALNVTGGGADDKYFMSAGFDKDASNLVRNGYNRITISANNTYSPFKSKLELLIGIAFTQSTTRNNNPGNPGTIFSYTSLADAHGNALPIAINRLSYVDTAGQGLLLDWHDRPLDELRGADNTTKLTDYRINAGIKYKIIAGLDLNVLYQYSRGNSVNDNLHSQQSFYTRDLINRFTQINFATKAVTRPLPIGGILDEFNSGYFSHDGRVQVDYRHTWSERHELNALAGYEIRDIESEYRGYRLYGYDPDLQASGLVDYMDLFPVYYNTAIRGQIPSNLSNLKTINHYLSYFANASYTYDRRYILSGSVRRDESNIFGVRTNQKGVPLWSLGAAWNVSAEKFYHFESIPYLKIRVTNGYNGNVNSSVSAATTEFIGAPNIYGGTQGVISSPPNPDLRWERGKSPINPTTGISSFTGNTANMRGKGFDVTINTKNTVGKVKWYTTILFSFQKDKVTQYKATQTTISPYLITGTLNPLPGHSLYSVYALPYGGLDSVGDPQGFVNGKLSKNYSAIINSTDFSTLKYMGPVSPTFFGSFCNTVAFKQLSLSFNIKYAFGHYFWRPTTLYSSVINGTSFGAPDFSKRWQKPGDEKTTKVEAMTYPPNSAKESYFTSTDFFVDRGDNIRLQDLQLSYDLTKLGHSRLPFSNIRVYLYARNLGILWKANHDGIDPDFIPGTSYPLIFPTPRSVSGGIKVDF